MTTSPGWLKVEHWYHVFVVLGAGGTVAALSVDLKGVENAHALLLSLGGFFVGIGEWINHPLQSRIYPANAYTGGPFIASGHPRNPKALGMLFDLLGFALLAIGLYKIVQTS